MTFQEYIDKKSIHISTDIINCSEHGLTDLKGIEKFKRLIWFDCRNNNITSLEGLDKCTRLRYVNCADNCIETLKNLGSFNNLKHFYAVDNNFSLHELYMFIKNNNVDKEYEETLRKIIFEERINLLTNEE